MSSGPNAKRAKHDIAEEVEENTVSDAVMSSLDTIQTDIEKLNDEATEEILLIEKKYNGLRRPFYKRRNEVISSIPQFWLQAFSNHKVIGGLLSTEEDHEIFSFLKTLFVEDFDDVKSGFKIVFTFDKNPFFSNESLTKEFRYSTEGDLNITCTTIQWSADRPNGTNANGKRSAPEGSFFTWFTPEDQDPVIGELIKEDIWPNPTRYYLGPVDDDDDDDQEGDEEDEGSDEEAEVEGEEEAEVEGEEGDDGEDGEEGEEGEGEGEEEQE